MGGIILSRHGAWGEPPVWIRLTIVRATLATLFATLDHALLRFDRYTRYTRLRFTRVCMPDFHWDFCHTLMSMLDRYTRLRFLRWTRYYYAFFARWRCTPYTLLRFSECFQYTFLWDFRHTLVHDLRYTRLHSTTLSLDSERFGYALLCFPSPFR